jgi:CRP-like cAMP-binding protein
MQESQPANALRARADVSGAAAYQWAAAVQHFALLHGISLSDCMKVVAGAQEKHFSRRQTIFFEGDLIRQVILLLSGYVKETQFGPNGNEAILRLSGPGEIVGALGLHPQGDHCSTARAVQMSVALIWSVSTFESICERFPVLRRNTARILERRLTALEERFREISTEKVALRLSSQLIRLAKHVGRGAEGIVEIPLSRRELAQLVGTTLFTVSRLLCHWEDLGIINAGRESVQIVNMSGLANVTASE